MSIHAFLFQLSLSKLLSVWYCGHLGLVELFTTKFKKPAVKLSFRHAGPDEPGKTDKFFKNETIADSIKFTVICGEMLCCNYRRSHDETILFMGRGYVDP